MQHFEEVMSLLRDLPQSKATVTNLRTLSTRLHDEGTAEGKSQAVIIERLLWRSKFSIAIKDFCESAETPHEKEIAEATLQAFTNAEGYPKRYRA